MRGLRTFVDRPRRCVASLLLLVPLALGIALPSLPGRAEDAQANALKVAYLYNFTRFIQWPESTLGDAFVFAVIGDPGLAAALRVLERSDKQVQGRPIAVRAHEVADEIGDCQVLFIGAAAVADLPRIRAQTEGRPVLLIGDSRGLAERGVAINLFLKPDILGAGHRLRFEISPRALKGRGLKVSAQLYDVAKVVE